LLATGAANDGWLASFRREMGSLIVIRHAGTPSMLPNDRLARAHRALLMPGQVEAAMAEGGALPGAASAMRWMAAAAVMSAREALDAARNRGRCGRAIRAGP
jgi:hypothetical protein